MGLGMDFGLRFGKANRTEVRSCFGCSKPNRYWGIPKTFFFFVWGRAMITAGAQGRASGAGGQDMEDREEMEAESTSNVTMLAAGVLSLRARQTLRLLKLGIPRSVTVLVRTCPRTY